MLFMSLFIMDLKKIIGDNFEVIGMVAYYHNNHTDFINRQMVDVSDGVGLYLRMKQLKKKGNSYYCWLEKSILSYLKWNSTILILKKI